ncbi:phage head closure protein [Xenorhabdus ehlersii]|uniref:Head-tail adaptor n=1 Tax=Xenorhabdus ehlersii TaxID=290111 RepID=A0A2D0IKI9_9GAMM|nr:phage head closure protein [Xenorhabdus ehlersii]PHM22291.1 head-tail adaptor [Xenorhabdus ehlersii]RKE87863.1 SPP1 family predicted phage head-tail adaptor [Xenorhabdus ehlersii]
MDIGRLRHRINIQGIRTHRTPSGSVMKERYTVATVWAEVKFISGRELVASKAVLSESLVRFWIRYRSDINAAMEIIFKGNTYAIQAVMPDNKLTLLELLCQEGVKQ